jgi:N-6 DNA Methylase
MSAVWDAVHVAAKVFCPTEAARLANLSIAAAAHHEARSRRKPTWSASTLQGLVEELALSPLPQCKGDERQWQRLAELAKEAGHLGQSPEGMHSWAAAYQRATATQKSLGAFATHNAFASALARISIGPLQRDRIYRMVDPSVGAGNLLLAAIELYGRGSTDANLKKFILSLTGVELDPRARELCCLLIWLFGESSGVTLKQVARNIRHANALTLDWWTDQDLFEVLLMNPPWESLRHSVDDDPGGERLRTIARLETPQAGALGLPPLFTAQGTGDRNLFKAFVELVPHLLVDGGRLGALIPAAFASDAGMSQLRERYFQQFEIARWTSFENRGGYFPIDSRYKFGLLAATRSTVGTRQLSVRSFAVEPDEVDAPHIALERDDIRLLGRSYHIIPELSHQRELEILRTALLAGTPLFEQGALGKVVYRREVDLSLGKAHFQHVSKSRLMNCGDATFLDGQARRFVPLLEGRSVGAYDCFQKSWVSGSGRKAVWRENASQGLEQCSPQYVTAPLPDLPPRVALCDVTSSTNTRTVIATKVPSNWRCGNTAPVLVFDNDLLAFAGLGVMNTMVFDWVARRLASGLHLNKFILEGMVWPSFSPEAVARAAHAAWSICVSKPRSGLEPRELKAPPWGASSASARRPIAAIKAAATLEVLVASGLGLSREQLETVFSDDRTDRRGFWRYFDATPESRQIAEQAVSEMASIESLPDSGYSPKKTSRSTTGQSRSRA